MARSGWPVCGAFGVGLSRFGFGLPRRRVTRCPAFRHSRSHLVMLRGGDKSVRRHRCFGSVLSCCSSGSIFVFGSAGIFPTHLCNGGRGANTHVRIFLLERLGRRLHL